MKKEVHHLDTSRWNTSEAQDEAVPTTTCVAEEYDTVTAEVHDEAVPTIFAEEDDV